MAYSLNQVTLLGNVGKDPEIVKFANGNLQATLTLATIQSYKPKDSDEWKEITDWHVLKASGSIASTIANYVRKGHKISIVGQVKNNNYEKDGVKHYGYFIKIDNLILIEKLSGKLAELPVKDLSNQTDEQKQGESALYDEMPPF